MAAVPTPEQLITAGPSSTLKEEIASRPELAGESKTETPSGDDIPFDPKKFGITEDGAPKEADVKLEKAGPTEIKTKAYDIPEDLKQEEAKTTKETEVKTEQPPVKEQPPKQEEFKVKPLVKPSTPIERDYSGFSEAEAQLAKKMSNEAFDLFKARSNELKEEKAKRAELETKIAEFSKQGVPSEIHHKESYLLDEGFRKTQEVVNKLQREGAYWNQQFAKIRAGEKWTEVYLGQDGKYYQREMEPNAQSEAFVIQKIQQAENLINRNTETARSIIQDYQQRYEGQSQKVRKFESDFFPQYADEKVVEGNKFIKGMSAVLRDHGFANNPLASPFAKMYAYAMEVSDMYEKLQAAQEVKVKVEEQRKEAGPSSQEIVNGQESRGPKGPDEVPFDAKAWEERMRY